MPANIRVRVTSKSRYVKDLPALRCAGPNTSPTKVLIATVFKRVNSLRAPRFPCLEDALGPGKIHECLVCVPDENGEDYWFLIGFKYQTRGKRVVNRALMTLHNRRFWDADLVIMRCDSEGLVVPLKGAKYSLLAEVAIREFLQELHKREKATESEGGGRYEVPERIG
ncbi:hypothetical protein NLI96_g7392 [Meripilus lineatus]|uniref:Uncharacterized protein n=1 Tax=Meripilus lineatus TaxID=2056292 RepID=A0AAD5UZB2_9APHY|nr:hypothetical protein NLI96_g7392 [Physisporinus lineatus]